MQFPLSSRSHDCLDGAAPKTSIPLWRWSVPLSGCLVSLIAMILFVKFQHRASQNQFETACQNQTLLIQRHIDSNITLLNALAAYAGSSDIRDWAHMHRLVAGFNPLAQDVFRYYWWKPALVPAAVQALESYPEDSGRVVFNTAAIRALIRQSALKGRAVATLLPGPKPLCLVGTSIAHNGEPASGEEGVILAFEVGAIVDDALAVIHNSPTNVEIRDEHLRLIHLHPSPLAPLALPLSDFFQPNPDSWRRKSEVRFAGMSWTVVILPIPHYLSRLNIGVCWGILILGLTITALLHREFERSRRKSAAAQALARSKSMQLLEAEGRLRYEIEGKKSVEASLRSSENRFQQAYRDPAVGVMIADSHGIVTLANLAICRMTGFDEDDLVGTLLSEAVVEERRSESRKQIENLLKSEVPSCVAVYQMRRRDRASFWVRASISRLDDGGQPGLIALLEDISGEVEAKRQLEYQATHDTLTGLYNRRAFERELDRAISAAQLRSGELAVVYIDLDGFKFVNDSLGHAVGDRLLPLVASRLAEAAGPSSILSRVGGDEFTIVFEYSRSSADIEQLVQRLLSDLRKPFIVEGYELLLSASIGIARYPNDGGNATALVQHADAAMYEAKRAGKDAYRFFTAELEAIARQRLNMEGDLRRLVQNDGLTLHFQPVIGLNEPDRLILEALCRWPLPDGSFILPDVFIPLAEETGLIVPLGRWVLREACRCAAEWNSWSLQPILIAVNVSLLQLSQEQFVPDVERILKTTGLAPNLLKLEITESSVMHNLEAAARKLQRLRSLGVSIALDDFGTGYSSLSRLRRLPLDVLKIDRSFIRDIDCAQNSRQLVASMIDLAHGVGLKVVSEGVESSEQAALLQKLGSDYLQGFLYSHPVPGSVIEEYIRTNIGQRSFRSSEDDRESRPLVLA